MRILNLTQHPATPEQIAEGVIEPDDKKVVQELLTFVGMPTWDDIVNRAEQLATLAKKFGADAAMIGGAPYLMEPLHTALYHEAIQPVYAFSERRSQEEVQPDGSVKKTNVFVHVGFVR